MHRPGPGRADAATPRDEECAEVLAIHAAVSIEVGAGVEFVPEQQELPEIGAAHQAVAVEVRGADRVALVRAAVEVRVGGTSLQDVARVETPIRVAIEKGWCAVATAADQPFAGEVETAQ